MALEVSIRARPIRNHALDGRSHLTRGGYFAEKQCRPITVKSMGGRSLPLLLQLLLSKVGYAMRHLQVLQVGSIPQPQSISAFC